MNIVLPSLGDIEEVEVTEICVAVGDAVGADDPIIVIESDKASMYGRHIPNISLIKMILSYCNGLVFLEKIDFIWARAGTLQVTLVNQQ